MKVYQANLSNRIFYELMAASPLNNLGRIKMEEGGYQEARRLFQEGLAILEKEESQKHIDQPTPGNAYQRALKIWQDRLGKESSFYEDRTVRTGSFTVESRAPKDPHARGRSEQEVCRP